jgi:hypothetical protein
MQRIIAFAGNKNSGKSTAERTLRGVASIVQISWADPIKQMAKAVGFPHDVLFGPSEMRSWEHPVMKLSARDFLKATGEGVRKVNPYAWINLLLDNLAEQRRNLPDSTWLVIPDTRHPEEMLALQRMNIPIIMIRRPDMDDGDMHESEAFIRSPEAERLATHVIHNTGGLEAFQSDVIRTVMG